MPAENHQIEHYAQALVALSQAVGELPRIERDLDMAAELFRNNEEIRRFVASAYVKQEGKLRAFEDILSGKLHPVLVYFVLILQEHDRLSDFNQIAALFAEKVSKFTEKIDGKLISARPLSKEKIALIEKEVSAIYGNDIRLKVAVDSNMLGGVLIKVGDFILDGTVEHQLESIRRNLLR